LYRLAINVEETNRQAAETAGNPPPLVALYKDANAKESTVGRSKSKRKL